MALGIIAASVARLVARLGVTKGVHIARRLGFKTKDIQEAFKKMGSLKQTPIPKSIRNNPSKWNTNQPIRPNQLDGRKIRYKRFQPVTERPKPNFEDIMRNAQIHKYLREMQKALSK